MKSPLRAFFELIWLFFKGFRPVEFVRESDRISLHPSGWRVNGTGRFKRAKDAVCYLDAAEPEQWRQIYCGMTPFLVSDKGNVKHIDGQPVKMNLANGRYQIMYKPEDAHGRGRDGRVHKKRVYRSMLVAMAWLDFRKGDTEHEIHHINGYRTDDRLCNLMVVDHEEHLRIHGLGPCGLTGLPDEKLVEAPAAPHESDTPADEPAASIAPAEIKSKASTANTPQSNAPAGKKKTAQNAAEPAANTNKKKQASGKTAQQPAAQKKNQQGKKAAPNNAAAQKQASNKPAKQPVPTDWEQARTKLTDTTKRFLEAAGAHDGVRTVTDKEVGKAAKPVYKALKPFLTCPDPVTAFDAALASIRLVESTYKTSGAAMPQPVHSMIGVMHQVVKDAVQRIAAEGDEVEQACLRELLVDETSKPIFAKTIHAKKFRQYISIIDSRNESPTKRA